MPIDADIRKIQKWAGDAPNNCQLPEDAGIDRGQGWGPEYAQSGGKYPEHKVFNQVYRELTAQAVELREYGIYLPWSPLITYKKFAYVIDEDDEGSIYVSTVENNKNNKPSESPDHWVIW